MLISTFLPGVLLASVEQVCIYLYERRRLVSEGSCCSLLVRLGSFADLANLVNMAAVKAAVDGNDKICTDQLEFAKDKILMGTERKSLSLSEESRKVLTDPLAVTFFIHGFRGNLLY